MSIKLASPLLLAVVMILGVSIDLAGRAQADAIKNAFGVPSPQTGGQAPAFPEQNPSGQPPGYPPQGPSGQPLGFPPEGPSGQVPMVPGSPGPVTSAPAQQPMTIQQYFAGTWHGRTQEQGAQWDIVVTFLPDGTFVQQQTLASNNFKLQIMGQYQAQMGPQGGVLQFYPQRWVPQQFCQSQNVCQPITMQPVSVQFRPVNHDVVQTEQGTFQRIASVN